MKKLLAVALAALVLVSVPAAFSFPFPRHVDPDTAPSDSIYGQGLALFYGSIVAALSGGNFSAAKALIGQAGFIHIPAEIANAINTFNGLVNSTTVQLANVNQQLTKVTAFVSTGQVAEAKTYLQDAVVGLRDANSTLTQLFGAEPQLTAVTGIPSSILLQKLQPLETVYKSYVAETDLLLREVTGAAKLVQTSVTLVATPATVEVGSNISVSGQLLANGSALQSRPVTIFFANLTLGQTQTDGSGMFSARFEVPYFYQRSVSLFASFLPMGNDSLVYSASSSPPMLLNVTFASPSLHVVAPKSVGAGQPLRANGTLSFEGRPLSGYRVSITAFSQVVTARTLGDGSFSLRFPIPATLGAGEYSLRLQSAGNGTIGPLTSSLRVEVIKDISSVTLNIPLFALAGFPTTITGTAKANGTGLSGASVLNATPSPSVDATTSSGGSFSFTVVPPITLSNGVWNYTVEVYPAQSWISPSPVSARIFVINPFVLLFPASGIGLLFLAVRRRRPGGRPSMVTREQVEAPKFEATRSPPTGLAGIYAMAAELVGRASSVRLAPQMTVREYLRAVEGRAKGMERFEYISSALETHLYGSDAGPEVEERAGSELEALRRQLEG